MMASLSKHHRGKCGMEGKCSVPMWSSGTPSGFCDNPAYGQQYSEGTKHAPMWWSPRDRNGYLVHPHQSPPYAPDLCCKGHGGPGVEDIRFIMDGDMWCAFMADFENLQESLAGFGKTQPEAEADLLAQSKATGQAVQS